MAGEQSVRERSELHQARWELLEHINVVTDKFMTALAFVWLLLLIIDFTLGLSRLLQVLTDVIWVLFILDFLLEFVIAPDKSAYLKHNWLTAISLLIPGLRLFRVVRAFSVLRAASAVRTTSLLRLLTSINRGMRAAAETLGRRNIGYVIAITVIVIFVGAAGMATFESPQALREAGAAEPESGFPSYSEAVWWTAMIMTTLGSAYWPVTVEGRILCWLLSIYALSVFGYITAAFASHLVGSDQKRQSSQPPANTAALERELTQLQSRLGAVLAQLERQNRTDTTRSDE